MLQDSEEAGHLEAPAGQTSGSEEFAGGPEDGRTGHFQDQLPRPPDHRRLVQAHAGNALGAYFQQVVAQQVFVVNGGRARVQILRTL